VDEAVRRLDIGQIHIDFDRKSYFLCLFDKCSPLLSFLAITRTFKFTLTRRYGTTDTWKKEQNAKSITV
jgi:hypothetical protein